jgi:hypothetical protein
MANSTFSGPVRSEGGFEQITVAASTGVELQQILIFHQQVRSTTSSTINARQAVDSTFNTASAASATLTAAQSGTLFLINGVLNNVVTLPSVSTGNVGVFYDFFLTVAVGAGTTTTLVLPGAGVSNFFGILSLTGGTAANGASDIAGDTFTFVNSTVANARVSVCCVSDDGTNSTWRLTSQSTPIATID